MYVTSPPPFLPACFEIDSNQLFFYIIDEYVNVGILSVAEVDVSIVRSHTLSCDT